jgi:hypothetical protein
MVERLVAVHQPNFVPWLGWFDKCRRANVMVLLDDAQFQKTGGTWTNRVAMLIAGQPGWMTVPIHRAYHGVRQVREIELDGRSPWREKLLRTIEQSYSKHPFASETIALLEGPLRAPVSSLCEYNLALLETVARAVGIDWSKTVLSSSLAVDAVSTARLVALVTRVGGNGYLAGGGAGGYQDDAMFTEAGIGVVPQRFRHPEYTQRGSDRFVAGLSIVDALMNLGISGTATLLAGNG